MKRFDLAWLLAVAGISTLLLIPSTRAAFVQATTAQPYLMGFAKFAVFATLGELLAVRIVSRDWKRPAGLGWRILVWGLVGVLVTLMFALFQDGVTGAAARGLLPSAGGMVGRVLAAFLTSAVMNLTFGPVFMAAHRFTDTLIDLRAAGQRPSARAVVEAIDWVGFVRFVVAKTIPMFWIPAHTITFLLPPEYRVLAAAYLSIALGAILAYARRRSVK